MTKNDYVPTLREVLDTMPEKFNDRTFIKYKKGDEIVEISYSHLRDDALCFCRMARHTFPEHTHIAVFSKSCYEYIVSICGILISGNVVIPGAPDMKADDAAGLINKFDVTAVIYEPEFAPVVEKIKEKCPNLQFIINLGGDTFEKIYNDYSATSEFASLSDYKVDPNDCCLIISTSGTTGDRKGVMLSTYAIMQNTVYTPYSITASDAYVLLSVLPLYHIFCFVADFIAPIKLGCTLCLNGSMRDIFSNMLTFKPESMRVVPMIAQAILGRINAVMAKHPEMSPKEAAATVTGGNLKVMLSGGAYLDPKLSKAFEKFGIFLRQGYGMSETGCKVSIPDEDCDIESVGRIMDILKVRVQDNEIQIDTPCRMLGYYKDEEATKAAFTEDGWLKTGDIGRVTEDGQLFISGRVKNLIILSNGENVSPESIENRYKCNKLVKEVLVYAEKDTIVAEVYPDTEFAEGAGITDIPAAVEKITDEINLTALPSHTVAKVIVRDEPIPKTALGKIIRRKNVL